MSKKTNFDRGANIFKNEIDFSPYSIQHDIKNELRARYGCRKNKSMARRTEIKFLKQRFTSWKVLFTAGTSSRPRKKS